MEDDLRAHRPPICAGAHARPAVGGHETDIRDGIKKQVITKMNIFKTKATIMAKVFHWTDYELELLHKQNWIIKVKTLGRMWIAICASLPLLSKFFHTYVCVHVVYDYLCTLSYLQLLRACLKLLQKSFFAFTQESMEWHSENRFVLVQFQAF